MQLVVSVDVELIDVNPKDNEGGLYYNSWVEKAYELKLNKSKGCLAHASSAYSM